MGMKYHVIEEELAEGPALRQPIMHNIMGVMLSVKMRIDHVILPQSGQGKRISVIFTFNHDILQILKLLPLTARQLREFALLAKPAGFRSRF